MTLPERSSSSLGDDAATVQPGSTASREEQQQDKMSRFVRASQYRHVFGQPTKKEACYDNIRVSASGDNDLASVNPKYLAVNYQASGGGAFLVCPLSHRGKLPDLYPLCRAHSAPVLDTAFNPFDDDLVASSGEDGKVVLTRIDEGKLFAALRSEKAEVVDLEPVARLSGHTRKAGLVKWHPAAEGLLASAGLDIKVWDVEKGAAAVEMPQQPDLVQSMSFNWTGTLLATTCKDKKLRIYDVRTGKPVQVADSHPGIKGSRVEWMGRLDRICTTGFSKMSERQVSVWDSTDVARGPVKQMTVDVSSSTLMPFWSDNDILFLAGKGDGNVRYYEYEADDLHFLTQYSSNEPQRGMCWLPRRALTTSECEIARAYKVATHLVEPISFIVPRKSDTFQSDIYPPAPSSRPALSASSFLSGQTADPILVDLEKGEALSPDSLPPVKSNAYATPTPTPTRTATAPAPAPAAAPASTPTPAAAPEPTRAADPPLGSAAAPFATDETELASPTKAVNGGGSGSRSHSRQASLGAGGTVPSPTTSLGPGGLGSERGAGRGVGEEVDELRSENARLADEVAERDRTIRHLELQLEKLKTNQRKIAELSAVV